MKRLNLDETWVLCLAMWKWIAKEARTGKMACTLKAEWIKKHSFKAVWANCFFCDWSTKHGGNCNCPAKKIDTSFHCEHNEEYRWYNKPIAFYKKLLALNKIRLAKKR